MSVQLESAVLPAAYCSMSNTLFTYEERDLFAGELFCPHCACRTEPDNRARTLREGQSAHPTATVYQPPAPVAQQRPHAR